MLKFFALPLDWNFVPPNICNFVSSSNFFHPRDWWFLIRFCRNSSSYVAVRRWKGFIGKSSPLLSSFFELWIVEYTCWSYLETSRIQVCILLFWRILAKMLNFEMPCSTACTGKYDVNCGAFFRYGLIVLALGAWVLCHLLNFLCLILILQIV